MQYSELGKFIKYKREQLGLSLNKLATESEVDPAILCRIENLKQGIKINVLEKLTNAFGMTPSKFLSEFENKNDLL
jgi:transcriptional regulator with XRE-family HTH domain